MNPTLQILFEDNHCLAVSKPAGLPTQGIADRFPSLEEQVRDYLKENYLKAGRVYLGIPHRLDKPVSGVLLFARQTKSAQRLAEQFQKRQVTKIYWAAVEGNVVPDEGTWEDWLRKIPDEARAERVEPEALGAKHALLHFRKLASFPSGTLLEIKLETGRMHQIRLQASLRGHPVLGDRLYGSTRDFDAASDPPHPPLGKGGMGGVAAPPSIALHARSLTFLHPIRYEPITVTAPLPETWEVLGVEFPQNKE